MEGSEFQTPSDWPVWTRNKIPVAVQVILIMSVATGLRGSWVSAKGTDEHNAGKSDDQVVHVINGQTVIYLKQAANVKHPYN